VDDELAGGTCGDQFAENMATIRWSGQQFFLVK
jgi:hypothetical protein